MSCSYDRSSKSKKSSSGSNGSDHIYQDHHRNYEYRCLAKLRTGTAATTSAMTTLSSAAEKGGQEWGKVVEVAGTRTEARMLPCEPDESVYHLANACCAHWPGGGGSDARDRLPGRSSDESGATGISLQEGMRITANLPR